MKTLAQRRPLGAAWLLALAAAPAQAQPAAPPAASQTPSVASAEMDSDVDLLEMKVPVVVTATRREEPINKLPYAVSVITAEDIRRSGARSVPDALRLVPGVDVADLAAGVAAVSPRGFHGFLANQTLVLVDGRQIFDSLFGGTLWGSWPFQLEDIQRIEVIRGPGGVTWGANAMNGVINIITKDPRDQQGLTLTGGGGSRGAQKEHAGYSVVEGPLRLRVSGEYEATDGFRRGGSLLRRLDDGSRTGRSSLYAIYDLNPKDTLTLAAGNALTDGGLPPPPLAGFGTQRHSESQASYVTANWRRTVEKDNVLSLNAYVNDFQVSNGVRAIDYRYQQLALQLNQTFKPADAHSVVWGVDTRTDMIDASNADPHTLTKDFVATAILGAYVQDDWHFAPQWSLNLGGRIDYEFYGGFQPSARAALSYEPDDKSTLYAAVSRAFQMPPAATRFLDMPLANGLIVTTGRRGIDAQTLIAYELGYRRRITSRLDGAVTLFWHDYDELTTLALRPGPPGLLRSDFNNRATAQLYGAELEARFRATDRLTLLGHYTWQQLMWDSPGPYSDKEVISPPKHKFMLAARFDATKKLHLSSQLHFVDAVTAPNNVMPFLPRHLHSYFRLDLRAEHDLWNDRASIAVGVRNLLDSNHPEGGTEFLNDAEAQRMIYAEFRIRFK